MRWIATVVAGLSLTGCVTITEPVQQSAPQAAPSAQSNEAVARQAAAIFQEVVTRVEPVAEAECTRLAPRSNCDYQIVIDDRPGQAPNAFQTLTESGRPIIAFNIPLLLSVRNSHELAFVMGHEAAHHIAGHIARTQQNAAVGAVIFSGLAALGGADASAVRSAEQLGATIGARTYSKDYELQADVLGTRIAATAGYDPRIGVRFFDQLEDPGNLFLGTHPPNAKRVEAVNQAAAAL
ncbi:M48 family metalloprotease [Pseudoprimorskyibacter insulae]|uniref:Beta-barrel assembly-enhancing protease n=1 Tax=Pseudoprimorskyibacter insulae TaxID=1695997 RepID=A0A2R8AYX3_9RHOB|nr:M48 family metalloprotease [Pseudoprimorskyibacter insulae]SPF81167.1 Beta-barrel assembly-enhancing protease [Pseudoprimorskyibacter insulae]